MDQPPSLISSKRLFEGRVFDVRIDEIGYADGTRHRLDVVEHGGSVAIVATPTPDEIVLVRQYRHPVRRALWEIPAGTAQPAEDPLEGARRELREETGYRASSIRPLGALCMSPGFCDEITHFFHAADLLPGGQALDEDERIEVGCFESKAAWRLVAEGDVADAKTVLALFWLQGTRGEMGSDFGR